jgi:hypothetical protein
MSDKWSTISRGLRQPPEQRSSQKAGRELEQGSQPATLTLEFPFFKLVYVSRSQREN